MKLQYFRYQAGIPAAIVFISLLVMLLPSQLEAQFSVPRSVLATGCVTTMGGDYAVSGTLGQSIIGTAKSTTRTGFFGFWYDAEHVTVQIRPIDAPNPEMFGISEIYPNPVAGEVTCVFTLPSRGSVRMTLYNMLGRQVRLLEERKRDVGRHEVNVALRGLTAGYYIFRIDWNGSSRVMPMVVLR